MAAGQRIKQSTRKTRRAAARLWWYTTPPPAIPRQWRNISPTPPAATSLRSFPPSPTPHDPRTASSRPTTSSAPRPPPGWARAVNCSRSWRGPEIGWRASGSAAESPSPMYRTGCRAWIFNAHEKANFYVDPVRVLYPSSKRLRRHRSNGRRHRPGGAGKRHELLRTEH